MIDMPSEHTEGLLRIGEVARLFNLSVGTLRHYEQMGLLDRRTSIRRAGTATTDRAALHPQYHQPPARSRFVTRTNP